MLTPQSIEEVGLEDDAVVSEISLAADGLSPLHSYQPHVIVESETRKTARVNRNDHVGEFGH